MGANWLSSHAAAAGYATRESWRLAAGLALAVTIPSACGTSATGVGACRQIEEARCRRAPACGISLEPPFHTNGSDVDACIRFYDVACLHGLDVGSPSAADVQACVSSIQSSTCDAGMPVFLTDPACAWLGASMTATEDASSEAAAASVPEASTMDAPAGPEAGSAAEAGAGTQKD